MEFFAICQLDWDEEKLCQALSMSRLGEFCDTLEKHLESQADQGRYFTVWGEFEIIRQRILGGYRFYLPNCQNTLAWTITTGLPPDPKKTTIHATINRTTQDPDFIESLEVFVQEWQSALEKRYKNPQANE
ncbi:MAG: hypothetical protein HQL67_08640 [Magnetococcales bacterium]|nr:hypothetical protein [Magnetococcales bacterium]